MCGAALKLDNAHNKATHFLALMIHPYVIAAAKAIRRRQMI